jgi:hypothetical protein
MRSSGPWAIEKSQEIFSRAVFHLRKRFCENQSCLTGEGVSLVPVVTSSLTVFWFSSRNKRAVDAPRCTALARAFSSARRSSNASLCSMMTSAAEEYRPSSFSLLTRTKEANCQPRFGQRSSTWSRRRATISKSKNRGCLFFPRRLFLCEGRLFLLATITD